MARKVSLVTITDEGRDQGKVFQITEMPASQSERWAARAFLAMARSGIEIPDDIAKAGMAGIAALGIKAVAGITFDEAVPLLAEMFRCVLVVPDPSKPQVVRYLVDDGTANEDIEEVMTRLELRKAIFELHVNFSTPDDK